MKAHTILLNKKKVYEVLKQKGYSATTLAEKMGAAPGTLARQISTGMTPTNYKLMCIMLGVDENELLYNEPTEPGTTNISRTQNIIDTPKILTQLEEVKLAVESLTKSVEIIARAIAQNDNETMKAIARIEKATEETKAQAQLNAESLCALESKYSEINGKLNRLIGQSNSKYYAQLRK